MKPKRPLRPTNASYSEVQNDLNQSNGNVNDEQTKPTKISNPFGNTTKSPFGNVQQQKEEPQTSSAYSNPPRQQKTPQITTLPPTQSEVSTKINNSVSNNSRSEMRSELNEISYDGRKINSEVQQEQVQQQVKKGNAYTSSETSQIHKRNPKHYKINPKVIPRPNHFDEIYKTSDDQPIYETNVENLPPYSNTHCFITETQNSTPRIIRSTLTRLPTDNNALLTSNLMFGFVMQPFAELLPQERVIPKVDVPEGIFRCKTCESYINNKYKVDFTKLNKRCATCNLCGAQNDLDTTNPKVKPEYFNNNLSVPELLCPTVDFIAPNNMKHSNPFVPHYIFFIDVSKISVEVGLPSYILNSITSSLDAIHNAEGSNVAIATFDHGSIKFFWVDKSEVKVAVMPDINRPFAPLPRNKLFMNVVERREEIDKIIEKIGLILTQTQFSKNISPGSVSGAAIYAGMQCLKGNGGRVMVFTSNSCLSGFGASRPRDDRVITIPEKEKSLYLPTHGYFKEISDQFSEERIAVDLFVIGNINLDFPTFSQICNFTGGKAYFYPINTKIHNDFKQKLEKLHYDITRVLTRPNYYDCKLMFRNTLGFEVQEILGAFGRKLGEGFKLPSMDSDYCFSYNMKIVEKLKPNTSYHFQIACLYIDNYNQRYLRMINYSILCEDDFSKMYYNVDVDAMTKLMIQKEMVLMIASNIDKIQARDNFTNKIIQFLLFYRKKCSEKSPIQQLILPASVKFIPLFLTSLMKKPVLRKNKEGLSSSVVYSQIHSLLRDPLFMTIKLLHPRLYRVDDITIDQSHKVDDPNLVLKNIGVFNEKYGTVIKPYSLPLSLDYIDFDCKTILYFLGAYLIDNGEYINLFVFDQVEESFYKNVFQVKSFSEINALEVDQLDEANDSELNKGILNLIGQLRFDNKGHVQPFRSYFLTEKTIMRDELVSLLSEDKYRDEPFYVDFLAEVHNNIQQKLS